MERILCLSSFIGVIISIFNSYLAIFILAGLLLFDLLSLKPTIEKSSTLIAFTSFALCTITQLGFEYLPDSCWGISLKLYLLSLCIFHVSEFLTQSYFHPQSAKFSTYLLNHSREYELAIIISFIEHAIKLAIPFPEMFYNWLALCIGIFVVVIGHFFRIGAEINAGSNFTHLIQNSKKETHTLVTSGFYKICRHPSYLGWFLWSVGTQIMLGNIICSIGFFITSRQFFSGRIYYEEYTLLEFFGTEYLSYSKKTSQFMPFFDNFLNTPKIT
ncbi:ICMT [Blepharisma stoltei]|uniref:Protein-S-isoprenylcysteine O-methyltransferase n=1 Tax=Blepharisma stoltei TaxID=1481888 RepID=A0AAU9IZE1_9CILI|nr:unnamed protein product [Blepharisma stoltei]